MSHLTYRIEPIKAFNDNYIWCIYNQSNAIVVDPGDAVVVHEYLAANGLNLAAILITHHHADHIGGVAELVKLYSKVKVYSTISTLATNLVKASDIIFISELNNLSFEVIAVLGHTLDHIVFYSDDHQLFCGDTLFSAGCGRVFEGTYEQMYASLMKIRSLAEDTLIYPAHEYTLKNLEFALTLEANNAELASHHKHCLTLQAKSLPSLPTTLKLEKLINPFLRCDTNELKSSINLLNKTPQQVFTHLRTLRNNF